MTIFPIKQRAKEQLAAGWAPFQLKNGHFPAGFPRFFPKGRALSRYLPINPSFQEEMKTQKKVVSNGWTTHPRKHEPKKTYQKQNLGGGFIYFYLHPYLGTIPNFDKHIFQMGWNHQPETWFCTSFCCWSTSHSSFLEWPETTIQLKMSVAG